MTGYIFRRLLWLAPVLIFLALITFLLMHLVPGGPWDTKSRPISPELREQLEAKYGLDEPVWQGPTRTRRWRYGRKRNGSC